jgi:hypothetical protein
LLLKLNALTPRLNARYPSRRNAEDFMIAAVRLSKIEPFGRFFDGKCNIAQQPMSHRSTGPYIRLYVFNDTFDFNDPGRFIDGAICGALHMIPDPNDPLNVAHESELEELKFLDKIASIFSKKGANGVLKARVSKFYGDWVPQEVREAHMQVSAREFSQISEVEARRNEIMAVLQARAKRREQVTEGGGVGNA